MVYLFGIGGFIFGFILGVGMIGAFLRGKSNKELLEEKSLRWTYGVGVWVIAVIGAFAAVQIYTIYFWDAY